MKLHSPTFERSLRQEVRRAVRASPQLKREFRNANRRRKHYSLGIMARPALCLLLAMAVWRLAGEGQPMQCSLAFIALWTFGLLFFQAGSLLNFLFSAPDLPALSVLPLEGLAVFRWEFQKFLRRSCWVFVDVILACSVLGFLHHFTILKWLAILPVALLSWLTSLSLAALLTARWPGFPYPLVSLALWILVLAVLVLRGFIGSILLELLNQCAPSVLLILPTGWPVALLEALLDSQRTLHLSVLVPIALVLVTLKSSLARLRSNYEFAETTQPEPPDRMPVVELESPPIEALAASPRRVGPTEIEEVVRSRRFLAHPPWQHRGWLERWLWRWLNPRERNLMEMVFTDGPVLTKPWLKAFRTMLMGVLATLVVMKFAPAFTAWVLAGSLFMAACRALVVLLGAGVPFRPVPCGGVNIPFHAGYPVGFRELTLVLVKYAAVQLPALIAFSGIGGTIVASSLAQSSWTIGMVIGIKVAFLLCALRFVASIFSVSSVTNDTGRFRIRAIALIVIMLGGAGAFLALAGGGLAIPLAGLAWVSVLLACLVCYGSFRIYAWFYDANRFDLMNVPRK